MHMFDLVWVMFRLSGKPNRIRYPKYHNVKPGLFDGSEPDPIFLFRVEFGFGFGYLFF